MLMKLLAFGVAGWAVENFAHGPRFSRWMGGAEAGVPFLPVYAAGGAAVMLLAPRLRGRSYVTRMLAYSAALGALEWAACQAEKSNGGVSQWDYGNGACVDIPHALAWGLLGIAAD